MFIKVYIINKNGWGVNWIKSILKWNPKWIEKYLNRNSLGKLTKKKNTFHYVHIGE